MDPVLFEESALATLRRAREHFLRNVRGLTEDQTGHDRCPASESIRETVVRLVNGDLAAAESLRTGHPPVREPLAPPTGSLRELLRTLAETHEAVLEAMSEALRKSGSRGDVCAFGRWHDPCQATALLAAQDYYLAGRVAAIRRATDPCWTDCRAVYED